MRNRDRLSPAGHVQSADPSPREVQSVTNAGGQTLRRRPSAILGFRIKGVMRPKQRNVNYLFLFQWYKNNFVKNDFQLQMKSRVHL